MRRIGIFGGTFNPPHLGHINACEEFYRQAQLDKLYIIPTYITPLKQMSKIDSPKSRLEMAHLSFKNYTVSDIETKKSSPSYTCDTVKEILELENAENLSLYVGSDMFLILEKWKNFEYLFEKCEIYTACRKEKEIEILRKKESFYKENYNADIHIMDFEPIEISSSEIRELFQSSLDISKSDVLKKYLTEDVFGYIMKNRLYESQVD